MKYGYRARLHPAFFGIFAAALLYHALVAIHLQDALDGIWTELAGRPFGSEAARVFLQLMLAAAAAITGGLSDAKAGWTTAAKTRDTLRMIARAAVVVVLIGVAVDTIYQLTVLRQSLAREMMLIVVLFGLLPYLMLRVAIGRLVAAFDARR